MASSSHPNGNLLSPKWQRPLTQMAISSHPMAISSHPNGNLLSSKWQSPLTQMAIIPHAPHLNTIPPLKRHSPLTQMAITSHLSQIVIYAHPKANLHSRSTIPNVFISSLCAQLLRLCFGFS